MCVCGCGCADVHGWVKQRYREIKSDEVRVKQSNQDKSFKIFPSVKWVLLLNLC